MLKQITSLCLCIPMVLPLGSTNTHLEITIAKECKSNYDIGVKSTYKDVQEYIRQRDEQIKRYIEEEKARKQREEQERKAKTEKYKQQIKSNYQASRSGDDIILAPHYNSQNLKELSNLTSNQIHRMLSGTRLECLADYYLAYEKEYGVNAIFLMSLNSLESGYGTSYLAKVHNNLGGYRNGNGSWTYFNSWHDCLKEIYRLIGQEYLSVNGRFHSGINIESINSKYCPNSPQWTVHINSIARQYLNKLAN